MMKATGSVAGIPDVSRETQSRFETYASLLRKWSPHINLVAKSTLDQLETRHFADSAQLFAIAPEAMHWVDLGTGGGFPGLVCAILAAERSPRTRFTLVEADKRKATFLRAVIREIGVNARVDTTRIETCAPLEADVVSARALADLTHLLSYVSRHIRSDGTSFLPKGATWEKEVEAARRTWSFSLETHKSEVHPDAVILQIGDVSHV